MIATITAVAVIQVRSLLASAMLAGMYSLVMALIWVNMNSVDVAFTEAAVGSGISTVLLLGALVVVGKHEKKSRTVHIPALILAAVTGMALIYGTYDMPAFADPNAPIHTLRAPNFVQQNVGKLANHYPEPTHDEPAHDGNETQHHSEGHHRADDFSGHSPNLVTSLLAAYRGFDTMFETAVIFTAGMAMIILLRSRRREDD